MIKKILISHTGKAECAFSFLARFQTRLATFIYGINCELVYELESKNIYGV